MYTITLKVRIGEDGRLRLDIPANVPPGPAEVVLVVNPLDPQQMRDIRELRGLGEEIWKGIDAQEYVDRLRGERER